MGTSNLSVVPWMMMGIFLLPCSCATWWDCLVHIIWSFWRRQNVPLLRAFGQKLELPLSPCMTPTNMKSLYENYGKAGKNNPLIGEIRTESNSLLSHCPEAMEWNMVFYFLINMLEPVLASPIICAFGASRGDTTFLLCSSSLWNWFWEKHLLVWEEARF